MLLGLLLAASPLLSSSLASTSHRALGEPLESVLVEGHPTAGQRQLFKRADGSVNLDFLRTETYAPRRKYGAERNRTLRARAVVPKVSALVPLYN